MPPVAREAKEYGGVYNSHWYMVLLQVVQSSVHCLRGAFLEGTHCDPHVARQHDVGPGIMFIASCVGPVKAVVAAVAAQ